MDKLMHEKTSKVTVSLTLHLVNSKSIGIVLDAGTFHRSGLVSVCITVVL